MIPAPVTPGDWSNMNTIWKFPLQINDNVAVTMPKGAKVLCVQMQGSKPCLWAVVDSEAETETRRFFIRGTGHPMPESFERYIGTVQMADGALIFHVFEDRT